MKLTKKTNLIITSCILVVAIVVGIVTGIEFYDFSNYDTYFYTGNVDEIQKYSQYSPLLKGTVGDSNIYVMHGSENTVALIKAEDAQTYASVESLNNHDGAIVVAVSDSDQMLSAVVYNTGEDDIALKDGIIGGLSMIYGNYDYAPKGNILPGGLYLGISTYDDVLASYGTPSESYERSLTYRNENGSYWVLWFDNDDHLDEIIVHHQPYYRSY